MNKPQRNKPRSVAVRSNLWMLWISRHWLRVALILLAVYISLPFAAPTLMKAGLPGPANVIYTLYGPFCHQFAFRSFFLYGEQPFYPRETVPGDWKPYEYYANSLAEIPDIRSPDALGVELMMSARAFVGNEQMGYKVTICERDISIYIAMFFGGLFYTRVRRRLRPAPWWLYIILGLGPIGLDGFSQLLSYEPFSMWPVRETMPHFRVLTGALFGLMNVWLGFPYMERSMAETRYQIEAKLWRAGIPF